LVKIGLVASAANLGQNIRPKIFENVLWLRKKYWEFYESLCSKCNVWFTC